jgi:hypothetical protein
VSRSAAGIIGRFRSGLGVNVSAPAKLGMGSRDGRSKAEEGDHLSTPDDTACAQTSDFWD